MQLKCSFSIVVIFNCCHFATDHPHAVKTLVVSLFVQMMKFKSYLSSYHPMQKASNWKSGLDMERWLTPWRTSTHRRPFTWEGNYLDEYCALVHLCVDCSLTLFNSDYKSIIDYCAYVCFCIMFQSVSKLQIYSGRVSMIIFHINVQPHNCIIYRCSWKFTLHTGMVFKVLKYP